MIPSRTNQNLHAGVRRDQRPWSSVASGAALVVALHASGCAASDPTAGVELLVGQHQILLETSLGDIELTLDADEAPKAVTNFVLLTRDDYYDGLTFHRVIDDFMIQGGDPTGTGRGGQSAFGADFPDEQSSIVLEKGVIAMANAGPNTNGSQFFIIQAEEGTPHLQGKHTAFGYVTQGLDVVDAIAGVEADGSDRPLEPVTMQVSEL